MRVHDEAGEEVRRMGQSLAAGVPVDRLAALIAPDVPHAVMEQLLSEPRFMARLSRLMMARLDLVLPEEPSPDLRFAALDARNIALAVSAAGAIWHRNVIRQVIARPALQSLIDAIGEKAHRIAMVHGELAVTPSTVPSVANLVCSIQRTGRCCVEAWLETVPAPIAALARLKLVPFDEPIGVTDEHRRFGPAIVRRVAESWPDVQDED